MKLNSFKWFKKKKYKPKKYKYKFVDELSGIKEKHTIYIETNLDIPWQIVFICPCGCKRNLHLNLIEAYKPYWRYKISSKNRISLFPSIHRTVGCKSHFFITKGIIDWCK